MAEPDRGCPGAVWRWCSPSSWLLPCPLRVFVAMVGMWLRATSRWDPTLALPLWLWAPAARSVCSRHARPPGCLLDGRNGQMLARACAVTRGALEGTWSSWLLPPGKETQEPEPPALLQKRLDSKQRWGHKPEGAELCPRLLLRPWDGAGLDDPVSLATLGSGSSGSCRARERTCGM